MTQVASKKLPVGGIVVETITTPSGDDEKLIAQLVELWAQHHQRSIAVRHETGRMLNTRFGEPGTRQTYGSATLKLYGEKLGIAESELSRMRAFASSFKSLAELKERFPDVHTWKQVRQLLAKLRHPSTTDAAQGSEMPEARQPVRQVIRAMEALQRELSDVELTPDDPDWQTLNDDVDKLLSTLERVLGVRITKAVAASSVSTTPTTTSPVEQMGRTLAALIG
jgi:hypothetical protein